MSGGTKASMNKTGTPSFVETLCARQPIFDKGRKLWGYEFLYRHSPCAEKASFLNADHASLTVAAESFLNSTVMDRKHLKVHVNFTEASILDDVPLALPAEQTVVEVPEMPPAAPAYLERLQALKNDGYQIALDGFTGQPEAAPLLALADIVKIDMLDMVNGRLQDLCRQALDGGGLPLAKRVEDDQAFARALQAGVTLFQGYFFLAPELMPGRKITSSETAKLRLFKLLKEQDPDFDRLAQEINADVSISYRLLSLLNSPSFGLVSDVRSIKQALVLLGWKQLKNWLRVVILTDLTPAGKPPELVVSSALRGRFLQNAAAAVSWPPEEQDAMFMLGLFSLLDAMLGMPMDQLVDHLPLEDTLLDALMGRDNRFSSWIHLARSFENAEWDAVDSLMQRLQLDAMAVAKAYREAMQWSARYFQEL